MRSSLILAACLLVLTGGHAAAQDEATRTGAAASRQGEDRRSALAARFVELSLAGLDKTMQSVMAAELGDLEDTLGEQEARWFRRHAPEILTTHMRPVIDGMRQDYAQRFTEAELTALVAFYDTPMGRTIARKQMESGAEQGMLMQQFELDYMTDLQTKFCGAFDCERQAPNGVGAGKPSNR